MTSRSIAALLLGVLLAACSSGRTQTAAEAECRREAFSQPNVRTLIASSQPGTYNLIFNKSLTSPQEDTRQAIREATQECLRRKGLAAGGGVEPVKSYGFSPL
jgi:hypothetical protein